MEAEIIAIGTELLLGDIVNSNASYLSQKLAEMGIDVYHHSVVGDNPQRITSSINLALSRADMVITTGGLGPTVDDVTVDTLSKTIHRKLVFDKTTAKRIKNRFKKRHLKLPENNLRQAYIPSGAITLKNDLGTAPGLLIKLSGKHFIACLPGPPRELTAMFENTLAPILKKLEKTECIIKSHSIKISSLSESKVCEKVKNILETKPPTTVGIYAKLGEVALKITTKAKNNKDADKNISAVEKKIRNQLKDHVFGTDDETLESAVGKSLIKNKKTLSIAESCTGGLIANRITDIPGSSKYFIADIIAYSNSIKHDILGIPNDLLKKYGAVSKETAIRMSQSVQKLTGSDIGLATTGIAGPRGTTKNKPVGLVYIAISTPNKTICREFYFLGERTAIKWQASQAALDLLRKNI